MEVKPVIHAGAIGPAKPTSPGPTTTWSSPSPIWPPAAK